MRRDVEEPTNSGINAHSKQRVAPGTQIDHNADCAACTHWQTLIHRRVYMMACGYSGVRAGFVRFLYEIPDYKSQPNTAAVLRHNLDTNT